jgi:hypothetical protein
MRQALERAHGVKLRVSYGKVAEYRSLGVVHFQPWIRLDRIDSTQPDSVFAAPGRDHRLGARRARRRRRDHHRIPNAELISRPR